MTARTKSFVYQAPGINPATGSAFSSQSFTASIGDPVASGGAFNVPVTLSGLTDHGRLGLPSNPFVVSAPAGGAAGQDFAEVSLGIVLQRSQYGQFISGANGQSGFCGLFSTSQFDAAYGGGAAFDWTKSLDGGGSGGSGGSGGGGTLPPPGGGVPPGP